MPDLVSTGIGDHLWQVHYRSIITSHWDQCNLLPSVGVEISTGLRMVLLCNMAVNCSPSFTHAIIIDRGAEAIIRLVASMCVSVRLSVGALLFEPLDLGFWHDDRPWPWLAWDCRSRSYVKGQGQTVKIVYALPFEPVVRSRSILGLGLPSSANSNCEWPLPVHWNCLLVSNQGVFNVSYISGRSALIECCRDEYWTECYTNVLFALLVGAKYYWLKFKQPLPGSRMARHRVSATSPQNCWRRLPLLVQNGLL